MLQTVSVSLHAAPQSRNFNEGIDSVWGFLWCSLEFHWGYFRIEILVVLASFTLSLPHIHLLMLYICGGWQTANILFSVCCCLKSSTGKHDFTHSVVKPRPREKKMAEMPNEFHFSCHSRRLFDLVCSCHRGPASSDWLWHSGIVH